MVDVGVRRRPGIASESPNVPLRGSPPVSTQEAWSASDKTSTGDSPELSPALTASLQLTASLLDEQERVQKGPLAVDVVLGGYHWIVTRTEETPIRSICSELSPRELEIARMVAVGLTNRAIASVLEISPWTVGTHLRRVFSKLEVNSRAAMVALIIQRGIDTQTLPIG